MAAAEEGNLISSELVEEIINRFLYGSAQEVSFL
jgi:hypothetical protein